MLAAHGYLWVLPLYYGAYPPKRGSGRDNGTWRKEQAMQKAELLIWLQDQNQQWEAFLDEFGRDRLEQGGVTGPWSMKDVAAHMTGWNRRLVSWIEAAARGESHPPPPWPADLKEDDAINAWICQAESRSPAAGRPR